MEPYPQYNISVLEPVNWAMSWTKRMLFKPFELEKWFVLGFSAWLSILGESGGKGGGGEESSGEWKGGGPEVIEPVKEFFHSNMTWLVPVIILGVLLSIVIGIVILWLRCRGKFMFLYCVARNVAEVRGPWSFYKQQGNSLFGFSLVLGFCTFLAMAPFVGAIIFFAIAAKKTGFEAPGIVMIAFAGLAAFAIGITGFLISKLTEDFVVPIMYLRQNKIREAWREFLHLLKGYSGKFVLYFLFQIVMFIAIFTLIVLVVLATCCTAACILIIPYIRAVLLLPVLVFTRSYSAFYLAQFGPEYNVFMAHIQQSAEPDEPSFYPPGKSEPY